MKNILIASATTLIIGLFMGYVVFGKMTVPNSEMSGGMQHTMPDGTVMGGAQSDMSNMMLAMMAALRGKTGDAFDKQFLADMVVHHQGAVDMAQAALQNAQHQEIKDLATAIISAQNTEIAQMRSWYTSWYGADLQ